MTREITAAILVDGTERMAFAKVSAVDLRDDEVVVRIVATGICNSDIAICENRFPIPRPIILGHEGAGIVETVGSAVTKVVPGDKVVLSFSSCGACDRCAEHEPAYCHQFNMLNVSGRRGDGSTALATADGPVSGHFFGQSSFATHSVANQRNVVKVSPDADLEFLGPFGCGIQTGAGAVLNSLAARAGQSLVIIGGGGVGLSAVMAGRIAGCNPIILSEPNAERRALALELGATDAIDPVAEPDLAAAVAARTSGGANLVFDTSGIPSVIEAGIAALAPRGTIGVVAFHHITDAVQVNLVSTITAGKTIKGICEGDSDPDVFIPQLVEHFLAGRFPVDRLVTFYDFADLNRALDDQAEGRAIKPIVRISPDR